MYRMDARCTNNQAEAFAILKAVEYVQINKENEEDKVATVHTDSRTTLDSLNNADKHTFLTEEIREKVREMESREWKIRFRWIKAHVGTSGNELADKLAKEASGKTEIPLSYNRVSKSAIKRDLEGISMEHWQREWETTNKGGHNKRILPESSREITHKNKLNTKLYNHSYGPREH